MADKSLIRRRIRSLLLGVSTTAALGCGDAAKPAETSIDTANARATPFSDDERAWPRYHSTRFRVSLPLPDGKSWRIDDHSRPELRATHASTHSVLTFVRTDEPELMNRQKCEASARERGLVPTERLRPIEDAVTVGPEAYDTHVLVAIAPGEHADPNAALTGHVLLFGAFIRHCLFLHFETSVPSSKDLDVLSSRLAVAKVRILGGLTLDPPRTTGDADVPREAEKRK